MKRPRDLPPDSLSRGLVLLLGLASILPYLYAWSLQDLRQHTVEFLVAFYTAFLLYAVATLLILKNRALPSRWLLVVAFGLVLIYNALLVFTPPSLSDDMYRYVWDGRVQAQGISPYRYPPEASELAHLREGQIWRSISASPVNCANRSPITWSGTRTFWRNNRSSVLSMTPALITFIGGI